MVLSERDGLFSKYFVTVWAVIECMFFCGLIYGWGSLSFVFKTEDIYANLCSSMVTHENSSQRLPLGHGNNTTRIESGTEEDWVCVPQDSKLTLCFTIGSAFFCFSCAALGLVSYKFGTRVTRVIHFTAFEIGSLAMAFVSKDYPWLMFPGLTFLGIGGHPMLITNAQVSNLFVEGSASVVGLLNGALDTSSAVLLMVKIASENGFSRQRMFFIISALHLLVLISTFGFLPKKYIKKRTNAEWKLDEVEEKEVRVELKTPKGNMEKREVVPIPSIIACIKSPLYVTHIGWLCVLQLRFFYFIGTLNPYLTRMLHGDLDKVSYYTNVCYYTMMAGLVTSFFAGFVYDWQKRLFKEGKSDRYRTVAPAAVPLSIGSLIAVIMSVLVLIPNEQVLYVTFIFVTLYKSFLYSIGAAFIGEVFPVEYFGMMYGIMITCGGTFGFLQYAFFTWTEAYTGGAMHGDILLLGMVCLSFIHPIHILLSSWREEKTVKSQNTMK